jgi:hypothetical protein
MRICVNVPLRRWKHKRSINLFQNPGRLTGILYFRATLTLKLLNRFLRFLFPVSSVLVMLLTGCEKLINQQQVNGTWVIRKDSSEMRMVISDDSVKISYLPDHTHFAYRYVWKQDEEPGLMECEQLIPLDRENRAQKIIPSRMYIRWVTADSISVFVPGLKRKFDLKKTN